MSKSESIYKAHKEQVEARMSQIIECPLCGIQVSYRHKARHERSKTHQNALAQLNIQNNNENNNIIEI